MCAYLAQWIMQSTWALHMQSRFGWSMREVGLSLMAAGVGMAVVQATLVKPAQAALGERRMLLLGIGAAVLGHLALGLVAHGWLIYFVLLPMAIGGLGGPAAQAIITRYVAATEQGEMQGALNSLNGIAAIVAPLVGTSLLARFATDGASPYVPGAAFFAAAAINAVGLLLAVRLFARNPEAHAAEPRDVEQRGDAN
jgi:DHA1 family tetracycline resistance protein-like MFS transporter